MRCDICRFDYNGTYVGDDDIDLENFADSGRVQLHFRSRDITQAIARGCWICRMIRDALLPFNWYLPPERHCKHDNPGACKKCLRVNQIWLNFRPHKHHLHGMEIEVIHNDLNSDWETFCITGNGLPGTGSLIPHNESRIRYLSCLAQRSRLDTALVRGWLKLCTLEHPDCQQSSCSPKRLLKIRDRPRDGPSVRLCGPRDSVKYACLSYCWGRSGNLQTLAENLERHRRAIPFGILPKTIQDAVQICLALRIYYLWVDALCIVQDDEDDWASECVRMGNIYSGAYVTLAAVQGHHSEAGLIRSKPFKVARIELWQSTGSPTEAFVHRLPQHSYPDGFLHEQHLRRRPLFTRGWVYQELMLSPRVLRFDVDELSFECREGLMCECLSPPDSTGGESFIKTNGWYAPTRLKMESDAKNAVCSPFDRFMAKKRDFSLVEKGLLSHSNAFGLWYRMVEQYSSMKLTKQSDRLPAFSTIASKFSRYGGRYYAGVWQHDLISGLQWCRQWVPSTREDFRQVSPTLTAPSWSWASQPNPVVWKGEEGDRDHVAKISIKRLTLSNAANIFGDVSRGYLAASGFLKPARLKAREATLPRDQPYELCRIDGSSKKNIVDTSISFHSDGRLPCELEARLLNTPNSISCFLLTGKHSKDLNRTFSLVLGVIDKEQGLYRRIGFMEESYHDRSWFDDAEEARILIE